MSMGGGRGGVARNIFKFARKLVKKLARLLRGLAIVFSVTVFF